MDERRIFEEIRRYVAFLNSTCAAPKTKKLKIAGVQSFFKSFYVDFPTVRLESAEPLVENIKIPEQVDIQDALKVSDLLERAVILVGVSSGLSAEDICNLKVGEFEQGYNPKTEITTLQLRRVKTRVDFVTFLTPEASQAVRDYLDKYRDGAVKGRQTDRLRQLKKRKVPV